MKSKIFIDDNYNFHSNDDDGGNNGLKLSISLCSRNKAV